MNKQKLLNDMVKKPGNARLIVEYVGTNKPVMLFGEDFMGSKSYIEINGVVYHAVNMRWTMEQKNVMHIMIEKTERAIPDKLIAKGYVHIKPDRELTPFHQRFIYNN